MPGYRCDGCGLAISKIGDNYRVIRLHSSTTTVDLRNQKVLRQIYDRAVPCICAPPKLAR